MTNEPLPVDGHTCDNCPKLAQTVVKGGCNGERVFYYCNSCAKGHPVEGNDD